jgi:hypothetical protein
MAGGGIGTYLRYLEVPCRTGWCSAFTFTVAVVRSF